MTEFRTIVTPTGKLPTFSHEHKLLLMGSCFSQYMGEKLKRYKIPVLSNPFGTVYNPSSVMQGLQLLMDDDDLGEDDLVNYNDTWLSFRHHTAYNHPDKEQIRRQINDDLSVAREFFRKTDVLILTFGTAWVYALKETGQIVSNCHKMPAHMFNRFRLDVNRIVEDYKRIIHKIRTCQPDLPVLFTVSPIRHWKDGAHENQLSKSVLLLAIDQIIRDIPNTFYFPSYEMVMDDLRDYRFYAEDMLHLAPQAVEYIWKSFSESCFSKHTLRINADIEKLQKAIEHRPSDILSKNHLNFLNKTLQQAVSLQKTYPEVDMTKEIGYLKDKINSREV